MEDRMQMNRTQGAASDASRSAMQMASKQVEHTQHNPNFLNEVRDADLDDGVFDWLEDELGPMFSKAHVVGNRGQDYEHRQTWLNQNKAERYIAERSPGRLLKDNPELMAISQDVEGTDDPMFRDAITSPKRRAVRNSMEVATTLQSLSVGMQGLDAFTTATAENRVVRDQEENASGVKANAKKIFE